MATAVPARHRVVEVIADLGPGQSPRRRYGSGLLVGHRQVLTSAHVVVGAVDVIVRATDKAPMHAELDTALIGQPDVRGLDLAVLEVPQAEDFPYVPVGLVSRDTSIAVFVEGCAAVGYPAFQEVSRDGTGLSIRETAQVGGRIAPLSGLVEDVLSLEVTSRPRELPPAGTPLAESEWSGMSGAAVFAPDGGDSDNVLLIGVVAEHSPNRGPSELTILPLDRLLSGSSAPARADEWWARLGVADPRGLPVISAATRPDAPRVSATWTPAEQRKLNDRQQFLKRVESVWIAGIMAQSVPAARQLPLALAYEPRAVPDPWADLAQSSGGHPPPPPPPVSVANAYETMDGKLLILGGPGSGKTIALLELTRWLCQRARNDPSEPIPVVFLLASWAITRQPIAAWLASELVERYSVPRPLANEWVADDTIVPLLDGLDEVAAAHRPSCVNAINAFQTTRRRRKCDVAVTCRADEYAALPNQLKFSGAIVLQPLTTAQISAGLDRAGPELAGVREALAADPALCELAGSPLILDLMIRTYRGADAGALPAAGGTAERTRQLSAAYVSLMLERRQHSRHFAAQRTLHWLTALAGALQRQSQAMLYVEHLQPDWLSRRADRWWYTLLDRIIGGVVLGALCGLVIGLLTGSNGFAAVTVVVGLGIALAGGTRRVDRGPGRVAVDLVLGALAVGGGGAVLTLILLGRGPALLIAILGTVLAAPIVGLCAGPSVAPRRINLVERVSWSPRRMFRSGLASLVIVVVLVPPLLVIASRTATQLDSLLKAVGVALILGLPPAILAAVLGGFDHGNLEDVQRLVPNQGIRRGARTALVAAGLCAVLSAAAVGLSIGVLGAALGPGQISLDADQNQPQILIGPLGDLLRLPAPEIRPAWLLAVVAAALYALIGGLAHGGYAWLSHMVLRFVLWRRGAIPADLVTFLDYAADCALLRRVGGGYMFVNRFLQDYFVARPVD